MYRGYTNFLAELFKDELSNKLHDFMDSKLFCADCSNLNELYDQSVNIVKQTIDFHAPMKLVSRKQQKLLKRPWLSKGILISIKKQKIVATNILC